MAKIKLTKTAVDAANPKERDYKLRDTRIPGFLVKVTPGSRKIFMIAYVTNSGQRRKPAIGRHGEITVEQARGIAQDWLAEIRRGGDPEELLADLKVEALERLSAAEIKLDWQDTCEDGDIMLASNAAHSLRSVLREIISNTIRHFSIALLRLVSRFIPALVCAAHADADHAP